MTLIYECDADILHTKSEVSRCRLPKVERPNTTDTQTDRQMRPNALPAAFASGAENASWADNTYNTCTTGTLGRGACHSLEVAV